jgi:putative transposase
VKFACIRAFDGHLSVRARCEALDVTEQGYHAYIGRLGAHSKWQIADAELLPHVVAAHEVGRHTYGTPRLKVELEHQGFQVSRRRIARIRDAAALAVKNRRAFIKTTDSNHSQPIAPNLLQREFVAQAPDKIWVSDITYLWCETRWLYLCTIIDCFSGTIVGRKISAAIDATLVCDTLSMAIRNRKPAPGCLFHSDRGSQYASHEFRAALAHAGMIQSMSRKGNCWDNAVAESSFARLKLELGDTFESDYEARSAVYEYIDVFYNFTRIHSRHKMAPMKFEQQALFAA